MSMKEPSPKRAMAILRRGPLLATLLMLRVALSVVHYVLLPRSWVLKLGRLLADGDSSSNGPGIRPFM
jgi:hypothetical protein